jgi:hypothetical protein
LRGKSQEERTHCRIIRTGDPPLLLMLERAVRFWGWWVTTILSHCDGLQLGLLWHNGTAIGRRGEFPR